MAVGNGKDTRATTLLEVVQEHGGHWFNNTGTTVIQNQFAQIRASQEARIQEAKRQTAIRALQAEADQAQADFVAAMKSSDYEAVAKAARRMKQGGSPR